MSDLTGIWRMQGYGRIFDISAERLVQYDTTSVSCFVREEQSLEKAAAAYDRIERHEDRMSLFETGGITRYTFGRIPAVPESCREPDPEAFDPLDAFDVFVRAFDENYAADGTLY